MLLTGYFGGYSTEQSDLDRARAGRGRARWPTRCAAQGKPLVVQTIYPGQPDRPGAARRRRSRCTATSTAPARCWPALVERRAAGRARAAPAAGARRSPTRRTTRRGRCSPTPASPSRAAVSVHRRGRAARPRSPSRSWRSRSCSRRSGRLHKSEGGGVVARAAPTRDAVRAAYARPGRAARPAGRLGRGDGRPRRRRRADRGLRARPAVRPGAHGRARRGLRRGARRHRAAPSRRSRATARATLLLSLRGAPLLLGARGRAPVDLDALAGPGRPGLAARRGAPRARRAGAQPGARRRRRGVSRWTRGSSSARRVSRLDVAQVALVERVDPGVLGREDAVVERP